MIYCERLRIGSKVRTVEWDGSRCLRCLTRIQSRRRSPLLAAVIADETAAAGGLIDLALCIACENELIKFLGLHRDPGRPKKTKRS